MTTLLRYEQVVDGEILEFGRSHGERRAEMGARAKAERVTVVQRERAMHYYSVSQTRADRLHFQTRSAGGWDCTCEGYIHTGLCKHLGAVENRAIAEGWIFGTVRRPVQ
jgi:hypothetical protein